MLPTQWSNEGLGILSRGFEIPTLGFFVLSAISCCRQQTFAPGNSDAVEKDRVTNRRCSPAAKGTGNDRIEP
jgi:hypothetical protein